MNSAPRDIVNKLRKTGLPVVICGAGIVGEVLLELCRREGIQVAGFCDTSIKVAGTVFNGYEVIHTLELKSRYEAATLVISVAAIKDVVDCVESLGYSSWIAGGTLLKEMDFAQDNFDGAIDYKKFALENCIICHDGYLNPNKLFLRSIDFIITERCSLKCRDCSNLMQYYTRPEDCDLTMLLRSMEQFFSIIDEVMDFRIIGGDAFMNRDWPEIVKRLIDEPKAQRIVIYTNGVIVPDDSRLAILKNQKSLVIMTDYGPLSKNIGKLQKALERNRISYHKLSVTEWLDCASISPHHRTEEQNRLIYKFCCAKNMMTLSDGKLFHCPYAANAHRLGAVPDFAGDNLDLFRLTAEGAERSAIRSMVRDFVLHKNYLETCDFCAGRPLSGKEVPPAIQTAVPMSYHRYF